MRLSIARGTSLSSPSPERGLESTHRATLSLGKVDARRRASREASEPGLGVMQVLGIVYRTKEVCELLTKSQNCELLPRFLPLNFLPLNPWVVGVGRAKENRPNWAANLWARKIGKKTWEEGEYLTDLDAAPRESSQLPAPILGRIS